MFRNSLILFGLFLMVTAVSGCFGGRLGREVSVPEDGTVKLIGAGIEILSCGTFREYLAPENEDEPGYEVSYKFIRLDIDGVEREVSVQTGGKTAVIDELEITFIDMNPEPDILCTVMIEQVN